MQYLQLHPGDSATVEIDANQTGQSPISVNDGPIESFLWTQRLGWLPPTTRFYGQVFTGGPTVVIRYHSAQPPDTEPIPFCAVARAGKGQMKKLPGSKPGNALLEFSKAEIYIVNEFR